MSAPLSLSLRVVYTGDDRKNSCIFSVIDVASFKKLRSVIERGSTIRCQKNKEIPDMHYPSRCKFNVVDYKYKQGNTFKKGRKFILVSSAKDEWRKSDYTIKLSTVKKFSTTLDGEETTEAPLMQNLEISSKAESSKKIDGEKLDENSDGSDSESNDEIDTNESKSKS